MQREYGSNQLKEEMEQQFPRLPGQLDALGLVSCPGAGGDDGTVQTVRPHQAPALSGTEVDGGIILDTVRAAEKTIWYEERGR